MKGSLVFVLPLLGLLAGNGCGSPGDSRQAASPIAAAIGEGAIVIDVRTPQEYARGHVTGSTNLPLSEIAQRIAQVAPDKRTLLLLHCQTGKRSASAAEILENQGYKVRNLGSLAEARRLLENN